MSAPTPGQAHAVRAEIAVRVAVTATGLLGLTGLALTELLHPALALTAAVVAVAAALATPPTEAAPTRQVGWHTLVAVALIVGFPLVAAKVLDQQGVLLIGALAAGGVAGAALDPPSPRSHLLRLGVAAATLALTAAGSSTWTARACVLLGGCAVLVGMGLAQRQAVAARAAAPPPHERTRRSGRAWSSWLAGPVAVAFVLAVVAAAVLARIPHHSSAQHQGGAGSGVSGRGGGGEEGDPRPGSTTREVDAYLGGALDLDQRGKLGDDPLFEVPGSAESVLWRVGVLDDYSDGRWRNAAMGDDVDHTVTIDAGGGPVDLGDADPGGTAERSAVIGVLDGRGRGMRAGSAPVLAPGVLTGVSAPGPSAVLDDLSVWTSPLDDGRVTGYTARWRERARVGENSLPVSAAVPTRPPDEDVETQLPVSVPDRVVDLSRQLLGWQLQPDGRVQAAMDPIEAARTLETFLRGNARYSLDAPLPERGQDPVDAFLFDDRIGFCEHFAAAEVVLLRAGGYPARLATGFAAPAVAPRADGTTPRVTLTAATAHAWVEVYVPRVGWVSSDPTAGATLVDRPAATHALRDWLSRHRDVLVLVGAALLAALLAGLAVWLIRRRRRTAAALPPRPDVAALGPDGDRLLAAFTRLEQALAARGTPRAPTETLADLGTRMRGLTPAGSPTQAGVDVVPSAGRQGSVALAPLPPVDAALAVLARALYGGPLPTPTEVAAAADDLDAAARALAP